MHDKEQFHKKIQKQEVEIQKKEKDTQSLKQENDQLCEKAPKQEEEIQNKEKEMKLLKQENEQLRNKTQKQEEEIQKKEKETQLLKQENEQLRNKTQKQEEENRKQADKIKLLKKYLYSMKDKTLSLQIVDYKDYDIESVIGEGGTSNVKIVTKKEKYAQKELKEITFEQVRRILSECEILIILRHPCIVRVFGFSNGDDTHPPSIILSLEETSLEKAIENKELDEEEKNRITVEVVLGMRYIHKKKFMHRDLKPSNILLSKNKHVRISDFGFAKEENLEISQSKGVGTMRFMAPELFVNEDDEDEEEENKGETGYTNKVDVYSFGITLVYIVTEKYPPFKMKNAVNGIAPKLKGPIINWVRELILRCLSLSPNDRPSFAEIFEIMKSHNYDMFNEIKEGEMTNKQQKQKEEIEKRILKIEAFEYQHQNE